MSSPLSPKREMFCREYLVDLDGVKALQRAEYKPKNAANASRMASELLRDPTCKARISALMTARAETIGIKAEEVLRHYVAIASADPRNLMQHIRGACRYCHGRGHSYQWRTQREFHGARVAWEAQVAAENENARPRRSILERLQSEEPVSDGGFGFNRTHHPHLDCPECDGLGNGLVVLADTRTLDPLSQRLFDGAKQTDRGIEIKVKDQLHALDQIARHLGMFAKDGPATPAPDPLGDLIRHIQQVGSKAPIVTVPPVEVPA